MAIPNFETAPRGLMMRRQKERLVSKNTVQMHTNRRNRMPWIKKDTPRKKLDLYQLKKK